MKRASLLLKAAALAAALTLGAGTGALAAHPDIPLYTFEEIGMQFTPGFDPAAYTTAPPQPGVDFNLMPVYVNADGKGFPYSPKMTCGNCHNGTDQRWDGQGLVAGEAGKTLVSYMDMSTQAFHAELGAQDMEDAKGISQPGKPWSLSYGMWGKW